MIVNNIVRAIYILQMRYTDMKILNLKFLNKL
jgi:hypothetical protein